MSKEKKHLKRVACECASQQTYSIKKLLSNDKLGVLMFLIVASLQKKKKKKDNQAMYCNKVCKHNAY